MNKTVKDLLDEFKAEVEIGDDFAVNILRVTVDPDGAIEQSGNALPVFKVEVDHEDKAVLLHFDEADRTQVTVAALKHELDDSILDYAVCAAQEKEWETAFVRLDTPLIGFGEYLEHKVFLAVCKA